jgi:ATP-dependent protease ClpP protease subunit
MSTRQSFEVHSRALDNISTINVRLNSYGDDVFQGLANFRLPAGHTATVVPFIDGIAASIASAIANARNEIRIAEAGEIAINDAWGVAIAPAHEMRAVVGRLDAVRSSIADDQALRTGQSREQIQARMAAETTYESGDAVEHGCARTVMPNAEAAARQRPSTMHWRPVAPPAATTAMGCPLHDEKVQRVARRRR